MYIFILKCCFDWFWLICRRRCQFYIAIMPRSWKLKNKLENKKIKKILNRKTVLLSGRNGLKCCNCLKDENIKNVTSPTATAALYSCSSWLRGCPSSSVVGMSGGTWVCTSKQRSLKDKNLITSFNWLLLALFFNGNSRFWRSLLWA